MDKNEMSEALSELAGRIIAIGTKVGTLRSVYDLEILSESLNREKSELDTLIRVMKSK